MKNLILALLLTFSFQPATAQKDSARHENGLTWYTDVLKANQVSAATNKPLFAFFTGSDWCGWCKRLQNDVFSKPSFIEWAKKNVVLVELDFPRGKQLSPELQQQNASLQQTFQVQGYPTIWMFFLNKDTKTSQYNIAALGSLGYPQGFEPGKADVKFLKDANGLLAKKPTP